MFEIYSSDTEEPQLNMSAYFGRKRFYTKNNNSKINNVDKKNVLSISEQMNNWNELKISIETAIEKLNPGNIRSTCTKLFKLNIMRGKGLLCRSIMNAQSDSLHLTHVYATLVSFINHEFPNIVELLLVRLICVLTNAYRCNEEHKCVAPVLFIAHLVKSNTVKDWLMLDVLKILIKSSNLHSMGMVDEIMKVCGKKLNSNPQNKPALKYTFDTLQNISQDEQVDKSVQCLAKIILITYRDNFEDEHQFDLVDHRKQFTHLLTLNCKYNPQYELDRFVHDLDYKSNEIMYKTYTRKILKLKRKGNYFANYDFDEMADDEYEYETETNMLSLSNNIAIKKTINIMVNLKLPPVDIALELMRIKLKPGQEMKLCLIYMDCCFENSTEYKKVFGDIIQSFCHMNASIVETLEIIFMQCYPIIHHFNPKKLGNLAKFFAQLLNSNTISWTVFSAVRLTESETTYSGRAYLKTMFNELILLMGRDGLKERILDPSIKSSFVGLFPLNNHGNSRLSFGFFADIGLDELIIQFRESPLDLGVPV